MIQLKPSTLIGLGLVALLLIAYVMLTLAFPVYFDKQHLLDFDIFYLVSTMMQEGNLSAAYTTESFLQRQAKVPGYDGGEMYWSYPPYFNMVVEPLAALPLPLSYGVFMVVTLLFYLLVLRVLAGREFHLIIVFFFPLTLLIIRSGQNSFLTGGLIALTCLLALRQSRWAGVPLGLMVIKPHIALGVGLWSLLARRWGMAAVALVTVALVSLLVTLMLGIDVWLISLAAIGETAGNLQEAKFPLFRMTSVYASALSFGAVHSVAMTLHLIGVSAAIAALIVLSLVRLPVRTFLGASVFASALISPYNYDYDLAMLAASGCLLADTVMHHAGRAEKYTLAAITLALGIYGFVITAFMDFIGLGDTMRPVSVLGPLLLVGGIILFQVIWRAREAVTSATGVVIGARFTDHY